MQVHFSCPVSYQKTWFAVKSSNSSSNKTARTGQKPNNSGEWGFFPGDIVIGEYLERLEDIKDGLIYVVVNDAQETDDIVLKRCLNYLDKGGVIVCKSDNKDPQYPTFASREHQRSLEI